MSSRSSPRLSFFLRLSSWLRILVVAAWTFFWTTVALVVFLTTRSHATPLALARRVWAPGVLALVGARLEVRGRERIDFRAPHLFVANHASLLDIPVAFAALPVPLRFLAKKELQRIPLVGHYITAMGMVFIDRQDSAAARESIDRLGRLLEEGMSLMAFPEGTRGSTDEIQPFKTGAFVGAIKAGVAVAPIRILGAAGVLQANSTVVRPGTVRVELGEPVPTAGLDLDDRRQLADLVRQRLMNLSPEA